MKWSRAIHHVEELAESCTRVARLHSDFRVTHLWAFGELLGPPRDVDMISVALGVDRSPDEIPWLDEPKGAMWWSDATRLSKNPVRAFWRSDQAPVWNHDIERPVLVWDLDAGTRAEAIEALGRGEAEHLRLPAPTAPQLRARLTADLDICLQNLRARTAAYDERRWSPGKLEPHSDALWRASFGYLDLLDAVQRFTQEG